MADEDAGTRDGTPGTDAPVQAAAWDARRAALDAKLASHRARSDVEAERERRPGTSQGIAEGLKLASEFVAGIVVGAAIGYGIDRLAGTMPLGLVVFLMIGFAAGVRNVLRSVAPAPPPRPDASAETAKASAHQDESRSKRA